MADDRSVTDEEILSGFTSLHEAMLAGFAALAAQIGGIETRLGGFDERFAKIEDEIADLRSDMTRFEHRVLRRFDLVDERLGRLETAGGL